MMKTLADVRFIQSLLCVIWSALMVFVMGAACGGSDTEPEPGPEAVATSPGLETGGTPSPSSIPESSETQKSNRGHMAQERGAFTATRLQNGRILVAGGYVPGTIGAQGIYLESAEVFDPLTGNWTPAASMTLNRARHTDTLLDDGRVLITGGGGVFLRATAEVYDPSTDTWAKVGKMSAERMGHDATRLFDGRVLVAGGTTLNSADDWVNVGSAEIYDPSANAWSSAGDMAKARRDHSLTLLEDGRVLVAGGTGGFGVSYVLESEVYDPSDGTWTLTGSLQDGRRAHTATLLEDGTVMVAGGIIRVDQEYIPLSSVEVYDPSDGAWSPTGDLSGPRLGHTATRLSDGKVLVAGGSGEEGSRLSTVEVYDPASGTWMSIESMFRRRADHQAELLQDGRVLVIGGYDKNGLLSSTEVYDPSTGTWSSPGPTR